MPPHCNKASLNLRTPKELVVLIVVVIELNEQFLPVNNLRTTTWIFDLHQESRSPQWESRSAYSRQGWHCLWWSGSSERWQLPPWGSRMGRWRQSPARPCLPGLWLWGFAKPSCFCWKVSFYLISFTLRTPALSGHFRVWEDWEGLSLYSDAGEFCGK